jgi:hypothetical protein
MRALSNTVYPRKLPPPPPLLLQPVAAAAAAAAAAATVPYHQESGIWSGRHLLQKRINTYSLQIFALHIGAGIEAHHQIWRSCHVPVSREKNPAEHGKQRASDDRAAPAP